MNEGTKEKTIVDTVGCTLCGAVAGRPCTMLPLGPGFDMNGQIPVATHEPRINRWEKLGRPSDAKGGGPEVVRETSPNENP